MIVVPCTYRYLRLKTVVKEMEDIDGAIMLIIIHNIIASKVGYLVTLVWFAFEEANYVPCI